MSIIQPFKAVRPDPKLADKVAALPYDVMNSEEAREMVVGNPFSFLHIDKAEIDLPVGTYLYDPVVYAKAKENFQKAIDENVFIEEDSPCMYIYAQTMEGRMQNGLVVCASIDEYIEGKIKKHELTREDKELDRIRHVDELDANTGPIFLTYRNSAQITDLIAEWKTNNEPVYDFVSEDGIGHTAWIIDDEAVISKLQGLFAEIPTLYIADGHHRNASAVKVGIRRREANPGYRPDEEFNYYLSVIFPDNEIRIYDYNRLVKDMNGITKESLLERLEKVFVVEKQGGPEPFKPQKTHEFGMYLDSSWYKLTARSETTDKDDPVATLDVSILQNYVLAPIFGISDPRTSKNIDFVGGIRGLRELEKRVDSGDSAVAFAMYPTSVEELMNIADSGQIMPPKSTWFEPKLRSGIFIHKLS